MVAICYFATVHFEPCHRRYMRGESETRTEVTRGEGRELEQIDREKGGKTPGKRARKGERDKGI